MKRIISFVMTAVMLVMLFLPVFAAEDKIGSITVNILYNKKAVSGLEIDVLCVAAPLENENGQYYPTEPFRDLALEINGTEPALTAENANTLSSYAEKNKMEGKKEETDKNGTVVFSGLTNGIYLVRKIGGSVRYSMSPSLVRIPSYIDGVMSYDIDITPKIEYHGGGPSASTTSVTVTKLWKDNDNQAGKRPPSIEVALYMDGKLYKTAMLSTMNGFKHTFLKLPKGHNYTVKETKTEGYLTAYDVSSGGNNIIIVNTPEDAPEKPVPTPTPTPGTGDPNPPTPVPTPTPGTGDPGGSTASIPVKKIWDDYDNAGETRPKNITVYLIRNGSILAERLLSEENNWQSVFDGLSSDEAYTIYEETVSGYGAEYEGNAAIGFTITNRLGEPGGNIPEPSRPDTPGDSSGTNTPPHKSAEKIPQTGMILWPVFALAAAGLILILASALWRKKRGRFLAVGGFGLICIIISAVFYFTDFLDGKSAENNSMAILEALNGIVEEKTHEEIFMEDIGIGEMQVENIYGDGFVGSLSIPELAVNLPVMSDWSYQKLKSAPCRYSGTADDGNFIILAHNYAGHFGRIKGLAKGAEVVFKDNLKQDTKYVVDKMEILEPYEYDRLTQSGYELTLFTCTPGGNARVAVRCKKRYEG